MKPTAFGALLALALCTPALTTSAETVRDDAALRRALSDELERTMHQLVMPGQAKPHFASYTVVDSDFYVASATHGAVLFETTVPSRSLVVSVRVGTPELDSSNAGFAGGLMGAPFESAPLDDNDAALRRELWLTSDAEYKQALEALALKKNALSVRVNELRDSYPDFSAQPRHETVVSAPLVDGKNGDRTLRTAIERLSQLMAAAPELIDSSASAQRSSRRRRLLSSEQTWADETHHFSEVRVHASTQADDGMHLHAAVTVTASVPSTLPPIESMEAKTRAALAWLAAARSAPLADSGTAVILFEGHAAAQLVQSLLGSKLSGTPPMRYVGADTDRSLASKLGVQVISPLLDVSDDPTLKLGPRGEPLWGSYAADDEGVPARKVSLIERGVLKTLLMSRAPRKEIRESNGHYRLGQGADIGNLIVKCNKPLSRRKLLELASRAAKAQGTGTKVYVVRSLAPRHAFALSGRFAAMHLDQPLYAEHGVAALEAYALIDGKEQPVRGLTIERLDLRALKDLLGAGAEGHVLNYGQGSEASIIAPSLLLGEIDVKRHEAENPKPPSYPPP